MFDVRRPEFTTLIGGAGLLRGPKLLPLICVLACGVPAVVHGSPGCDYVNNSDRARIEDPCRDANQQIFDGICFGIGGGVTTPEFPPDQQGKLYYVGDKIHVDWGEADPAVNGAQLILINEENGKAFSSSIDHSGTINITLTGKNVYWGLKFKNTSVDPRATEGVTITCIPVAQPHISNSHDLNNNNASDIAWRDTGGTAAAWLMNGAQVVSSGAFGLVANNWVLIGQGDFNGDGNYDWLWRDSNTGAVAIWLLNGLQVSQSGNLGVVPSNWGVVGISDFDGDGKADILWRDSNTGTLAIWLLNGLQVSQSASIGTVQSNWSVAGTNAKGYIYWRDSTTGSVAIWVMRDFEIAKTGNLGAVPSNWAIAGIGDFDSDGHTDLLWRDGTTGTVAIWLLNRVQVAQTGGLGTVSTNWVIAETGDFEGDGKTDILWRDTTSGTTAIWFMNGLQVSSSSNLGVVPSNWTIQGLNAD